MFSFKPCILPLVLTLALPYASAWLWYLLAATLVVVVTLAVTTYDHDYWKRQGIFSPPACPLVGHILSVVLFKEQGGMCFKRIYDTYKNERFLGTHQFYQRTLVVRDPELIKRICVNDFQHFVDRGFFFNKEVDPLAGSVLFLRGSEWRKLRAKISPIFSPNKLRAMFPLIENTANEFIFRIRKLVDNSNASTIDTNYNKIEKLVTNDIKKQKPANGSIEKINENCNEDEVFQDYKDLQVNSSRNNADNSMIKLQESVDIDNNNVATEINRVVVQDSLEKSKYSYSVNNIIENNLKDPEIKVNNAIVDDIEYKHISYQIEEKVIHGKDVIRTIIKENRKTNFDSEVKETNPKLINSVNNHVNSEPNENTPHRNRNHKSKDIKSTKVNLIDEEIQNKLKSILRDSESETDRNISEINSEVKSVLVDSEKLVGGYTADAIVPCAFGLKSSVMDNENDPFAVALHAFYEMSWFNIFEKTMRQFWPAFVLFFRMRIIPKKTHDFFHNIVTSVLRAREKGEQEKRGDFIDMMMALRSDDRANDSNGDDVDNDVEITDMVISANAFIIFLGGFETTSSTLAFLLLELAANPGVQERLRQEVREVLDRHGGQVTYEVLQEMTYMEYVIQETLRLYPPFPSIQRLCTRDYPIPGSQAVIQKGTIVLFPTLGIQRDEQYFESAGSFVPERWARSQPPPGVYMPFGDGPRYCIGKRFALIQMKCCLIHLMQHVRFTTTHGSRRTEPFAADPRSPLTLHPADSRVRISLL